MNKRSDMLRGMRDAVPVGLGYLAVSFAFGLAAARMGIPALAATLMSLSNLTSAGQFAGVGVIAAGGGLAELALTQLVINARYFLMSCALSQRIAPKAPLWQRAAVSFGVTDEIFALSMAAKEPLSPWYSFGMMGLCIFGWTLGTALGATLGGVLPAPLMNALGIALYAMLTAAIVPPSRDNRLLRLIIVVSMATSGAAAVLPLLSAIPKGLRIVLLTLVITGWAALRHPLEEVRDA